MSLRVYDLAKELKISSAALMKHLSDMGVDVRSHMNYLEDEITNKIRYKFRSEVENLKKMENERKRIQEQLRDGKIETQPSHDKSVETRDRSDHHHDNENRNNSQNSFEKAKSPVKTEQKEGSHENQEQKKDIINQDKAEKSNETTKDSKPVIEVHSEVPGTRFKSSDNQETQTPKPEQRNREGYQPRDNRTGYQGQNRSEGYQPRENRSGEGYQGQNRTGYQGQNRSEGYQPRENRSGEGYQGQNRTGYQGQNRSEGYQPRENRSGEGYQGQNRTGYQGQNRSEGYQPRENRSGEGYQGQNRTGYQGQNRSEGYQPRENRSGEGYQGQNRTGYQGQNRSEGYQPRENRSGEGYQGQNRTGYQGQNRSEGYQPRENRSGEGYQGQNRGGYQGQNRSEGYQPRENRSGEGYQGQNRTGYQGQNRSEGYQPRENRSGEGYQGQNRGGYQGQNRSEGYQPRDNRPSRDGGRQDYAKRSSIVPQSKRPSFDKTSTPKPEEVKPEEKIFGKKKVTIDDLGDKSKHLQAKLKNTKRKKKGVEVVEIDEVATEKIIKQTLATGKKKKKYKKEEKRSNILEDGSVITISEFTSVSELAKIMDKTPSEIISKFFVMGKMVTINQRLDRESLELICDEFNLNVDFEDEYGSELLEDQFSEYSDVEDIHRPPVVTIMGHVDHGKTSILDYIRKTKVVAGESGGITQHVGAYQVTYKGHKITFLDTPGHEAFTAMRARGANLTDIAVIVVAANDGVKPQTIEAIDHARAAGVTMIIAINKMDLPEANLDRTIANLLEQNVYLENWGGEVLWTTTSAITGKGIDDLLELILLASEMKELTAKYNIPGYGVVIEAKKDPRMGSIATILLQEGIMNKGDNIVCGATYGHVRRMENERGTEIPFINPCDICVLYGLSDVPKAGDIINVVESEKIARQISSERLLIRQEREKFQTTTNLGNLFNKIKQNEMNEVRLIVKGDTDGSVEALCDTLQKLSNEEIVVNIIRKSVGGIIEADVNLASASDAIIIGFHVRANTKAKKLSEDIGVDIRLYQIIFDAINDIKLAMTGMLAPEIKEKFVGHALVKQVFKIKKVGSVAGCFVEKGSVIREGLARLFRDDVNIFEGKIGSLKHFSEEVKEVKAGSDCGILIKDYNDIRDNDVIEIYINEEIKREM